MKRDVTNEGLVARLFAVDLRSLALLRISLAILIGVDLIARARDLTAHYTDLGIMPCSVAIMDNPIASVWSAHLWGGSFAYQAVLFSIAGALAVCLLLGYRTRVVTIVSWYLLISLHTRNHAITFGVDQLLRMLLFWSMFLPLGARWSLDSRRAMTETPTRVLSAASAAILVQVFLVYFFAAQLKSGPTWYDGTAVERTLNLYTTAEPFGRWLLQFPRVLEFLTYSSWTLEFFGAFLLFSPFFTVACRLVLIMAFATLQIGFSQTLNLGLFPWVSIAAMLPFAPSCVWDRTSIAL